MSARDVLNKLKWHPDYDLSEAEITILHRGAPRDRKVIEGEEILDIGSGFMKVKSGERPVEIPYHRILKIGVSGEIVWRESP